MQNRLFVDIHDISELRGQFIIQINNDDFSNTIVKNGEVDSFWIEKRISQVVIAKEKRKSLYMLSGIFYPHSSLLSLEELVEKINSIGEDRHYRLMSALEVKLMVDYNLERITKYENSSRERSLKD